MLLNNTPVSIEEFRTNLADLFGRVMYGKDRIFIKKYNREAAVLLSMEDFENLLNPIKRLSNKEWQKRFETMEAVRNRMSIKNQAAFEDDVNQTIQTVRAQQKQK